MRDVKIERGMDRHTMSVELKQATYRVSHWRGAVGGLEHALTQAGFEVDWQFPAQTFVVRKSDKEWIRVRLGDHEPSFQDD